MSLSPFSTRTRRQPAHRAGTSKRGRFVTLSGILTSTAIIGSGAFLGLTSVGGTYAFWDGSSNVGAPVVGSGDMALAVGVAGSESASYTIPSTAWSSLLPGESVRQQVSVKVNNNPSRISSALVITTTDAVPTGFELRVQKGACPGAALAGTPLSTSELSFGTWGPAETSAMCVQVTLRNDAPNSTQTFTTPSIGMTVTAKQL